jgi:chromosome partitioning protein
MNLFKPPQPLILNMIITVANQKGGVGKTDLCVNLASYLASKGKKTLLLDMDPQANATEYLSGKPGKRDSSRLLVDKKVSLRDATIPTKIKNLSIVPGSQRLSAAQVEVMNDPGMQFKLKRKLAGHGFDYVLIDTPPSLGMLTLNALTASDSVLVPVQVHYLATMGVEQLLNTVRMVKKEINPGLSVRGYVLTMHDRRNNLTARIESELRKTYGKDVFETVVPVNVDLAEAPRKGMPIMLYNKDSRGAYAYERLAKEFMGG